VHQALVFQHADQPGQGRGRDPLGGSEITQPDRAVLAAAGAR